MASPSLRVNGCAVIMRTKKLPDEVKETIITPSVGKVKMIVARMTDEDGNEVVLRGPVSISSGGSVMARFSLVLKNFHIEEVDAKPEKEKKTSSPEELAKVLLSS